MYLLVEPKKCTHCLSCEIFCSLTQEGFVNPDLARIQVLHDELRGSFIPQVCIPCEEKACMAACPEPGAMRLDESGAVLIVEILCTACGKCAKACLAGAIHVHRLPGRGKKGLAVALKCNQCQGDPACVKACAPGALTKIEKANHSQKVFNMLAKARSKFLVSKEISQ